MGVRQPKPKALSRWQQIASSLPRNLHRLLESPVYGRGPRRVPPPRMHGVYLFTERGRHLYVGRTGRTERSLMAGKQGSSNFRSRLAGHSRPSSPHDSAPFAWRIALRKARRQGLLSELPADRKGRAADPRLAALFVEAKERVTAMEFRVVEIPDDPEAYAFEVYAASVLETPYNSFATS